MNKRAEELLERGVVALEKLVEEPSFEIPTSPPVCPHCGTFDPNVSVEERGGQGKLSQYFLKLTCLTCSKPYMAVPQGFVNFSEVKELQEFLERAENGNSAESN